MINSSDRQQMQIRPQSSLPQVTTAPKMQRLCVAYGRWSFTRIEPLGVSFKKTVPDTSTLWKTLACKF